MSHIHEGGVLIVENVKNFGGLGRRGGLCGVDIFEGGTRYFCVRGAEIVSPCLCVCVYLNPFEHLLDM